MSLWDAIYSEGSIHTKPSQHVVHLIPRLKSEGIIDALDLGCGTGRHAEYLAEQGFSIRAIDVSDAAIRIADARKNNHCIDYCVGSLTRLPYPDSSADFALANHSLEYATWAGVIKAMRECTRVLRRGRPLFARVVSTQHPLYGLPPAQVFGFSHVGFAINTGLPVHFFSEQELLELCGGYRIERLEHHAPPADHAKISVPLKEWVLLAYKR